MASSSSKGKASENSAGLSDAHINARFSASADEDLREYIKRHNHHPWTLGNPTLLNRVEWFNENATYSRLVAKRSDPDAGAEEAVLSVIGEFAGDSFRLQVDGDYKTNDKWNSSFEKTKRTARLAQPRDKLLAPLFFAAVENAGKLMNSRRNLHYTRRNTILEDKVFKVRQQIFEEKSVLIVQNNANKNLSDETETPETPDKAVVDPEKHDCDDAEAEEDILPGVDKNSPWWMENWTCNSTEAKEELTEIIQAGKLVGLPLPAFRIDKSQIHPDDITNDLKGALVEVHFALSHAQWNFKKVDDYYADIRSIVRLCPSGYGTLISSPMKRGIEAVMPSHLEDLGTSPTKKPVRGRK